MTSEHIHTDPDIDLDPATEAERRLLERLPLWVGSGLAVFAVLILLSLVAHKSGVPVLLPGHQGSGQAFHGH
jgi:hypothetical protein